MGTRRTHRHRLHVSRLPQLSSQHPRPRLHRHQNQHRLQNHQPQQPTKRPLATCHGVGYGPMTRAVRSTTHQTALDYLPRCQQQSEHPSCAVNNPPNDPNHLPRCQQRSEDPGQQPTKRPPTTCRGADNGAMPRVVQSTTHQTTLDYLPRCQQRSEHPSCAVNNPPNGP